jgi:hypothetical protein
MPRTNKRAAVDRSATARNSRTPDRPEPGDMEQLEINVNVLLTKC